MTLTSDGSSTGRQAEAVTLPAVNSSPPPPAPSLQKSPGLAVKSTMTLALAVSALGVSALSLTVSILGFYYTNLRVEDDLSARVAVLEFRPRESSEPPYRNIGALAFVKIVLVNSGNRPAVVFGVDYQYNGDGDPGSGHFNGELPLSQSSFPLLIPPKEIRLIESEVPIIEGLNSLAWSRRLDTPVSKDDASTLGKSSLRFQFCSIDSRGRRFIRHSPFLAEVKVYENSVRPTPSREYDEKIDLLQNDVPWFLIGPTIPP